MKRRHLAPFFMGAIGTWLGFIVANAIIGGSICSLEKIRVKQDAGT